MVAVVGQGAVDGAVAGGGDVALVAGLSQQQVTVDAVTLGGEAIRTDRLDERQGAVRVGLHQAVGQHEPAVIAMRPATTRDHRHEW